MAAEAAAKTTTIIDIYDGCLDEGIRTVDVRPGQVAALAP
jgi:hypothetical protein